MSKEKYKQIISLILIIIWMITVFMLLSPLSCLLLRACITRKNTSSGAIALRAPTNRSPRMPMMAALGMIIPRITPTISPAMILLIRLISVHFLNISIRYHFPFLLFIYCFYSCSLILIPSSSSCSSSTTPGASLTIH